MREYLPWVKNLSNSFKQKIVLVNPIVVDGEIEFCVKRRSLK